MRIGVFTPLLSHLSIDDVMKKLKSLGVTTFELGTGNYPGDPHCKLSMLESKTALKEFKQKLDDNGFTISALSSHGNPLHPDPVVAKKYQDTSRKTVLLAEKLRRAGCDRFFPAAPAIPTKLKVSQLGDHALADRNISTLLAWQWEKKVTPYWKKHAANSRRITA